MSPGRSFGVGAFLTGSSTHAVSCVNIIVLKQIQLGYSVTVSHDAFWCFPLVSNNINNRDGASWLSGKFQHRWQESVVHRVKAHMRMLLLTFHLHCSVKGLCSWLGKAMFSRAKLAQLLYALTAACIFPARSWHKALHNTGNEITYDLTVLCYFHKIISQDLCLYDSQNIYISNCTNPRISPKQKHRYILSNDQRWRVLLCNGLNSSKKENCLWNKQINYKQYVRLEAQSSDLRGQ